MDNFEFNSDWSSGNKKHDAVWNEQQALSYLKKTKLEVQRFVNLYKKAKNLPQRLDTVASFMGWCQNEWTDDSSKNLNESPEFILEEIIDFSEDMLEDRLELLSQETEPYLFYRYPECIAIKALFCYLKDQLMAIPASKKSKDLFDALLNIQSSIDLAFADFDLGEGILAICHAKQIFAEINKLLSIAQEEFLDHRIIPLSDQKELIDTLFDLREITLRFLSECREESEGL
ncbi:MAG: hypothetical protein A2007_03350 [Verrucomicrobia bacterium GWC2_42_7]|nr:MAG: hypothetical protein A2007_03350 [Verrucomicrobia bacterium GWC2_42_7]